MCEEEQILADKLVRRDDVAWEQFCREYSGPLLSAVRLRFGCSGELAEEIVHMTFIRCVKSINTFDPAKGRLFDWLKAIARNEARTLFSKVTPKEQMGLDPEDQVWLQRVDEAELPDQQLCRAEVRSLVLDTMMELGLRQRQVLVMKYLQDRPVAAMALTLGQSEKAIESLLTRSRQALKERLTRRFTAETLKGGPSL